MHYCLISMKYTVARQSPRELRTGNKTKFWHYCICISSIQCKRLVVLVGRKHVPSHKFGFIRVGCFIVCSQTPRGGSQQLMPPTTTSYNDNVGGEKLLRYSTGGSRSSSSVNRPTRILHRHLSHQHKAIARVKVFVAFRWCWCFEWDEGAHIDS